LDKTPGIPEIDVQALAAKLRSKDQFILLDVREQWEVDAVSLSDSRLAIVPMTSLAQLGVAGLPEAAQSRESELLVLCHHGVRSAQVAAWLSARGWTRVYSVSGGIDEYARKVDPSIGTY